MYLKSAIIDNAVHGGDDNKQCHLATDASGYAIGGVLFQLYQVAPGHQRHAFYPERTVGSHVHL